MSTDLLTTLGAILVLLGGLAWIYLRWGQYKSAPPEERHKMLVEDVNRLVAMAEQRFQAAKAGQAKYGFVINRLVQRFPELDFDTLSEYIEAAVHQLNERKAARGVAHRNGASDA